MSVLHKLAFSMIVLLLYVTSATPRARADAYLVPLDGSQPDVKPADFGYQIETQIRGRHVDIYLTLSPAAAKSFGHADLSLSKAGATVLEATLGLERDPDHGGRMKLTLDPQTIDSGELIILSGHIQGEPVSATSTIRNFGGFRISIAKLLADADEEAAVRTLMRREKSRIDGTEPPAAWPEDVRRAGRAWVVDIDTEKLPGGYPEQIVVEVTATGGHTRQAKR